MAPLLDVHVFGHNQFHTRSLDKRFFEPIVDYLYHQWHVPSDILSLLLLLGPEVVQNAVAQLTGRVVTPVAFSFGWVAYAVSTILPTIGGGRLMPDASNAKIHVIGASSGHVRMTDSWIISRLLRDLDDKLDKEMRDEAAPVLSAQDESRPPTGPTPASSQSQSQTTARKAWEALRGSVYEVEDSPPRTHGVPTIDWVWLSGFVVIPIQLGISLIPWITHKDWTAFLITASGTSMAIAGASLPQWRREKWSCPKVGGATVTLTRGNGSRHAVVIKGKRKVGLDMEILAQDTRTTRASLMTRFATGFLALLWVSLLITVAGVKTNTWYILAVGMLGSMQNILVAAAPRSIGAHGLHLRLTETIAATRVAHVLRTLEQNHPSVGVSLLKVFFPGGLRAKGEELDFWRGAISTMISPNQHGARIDLLGLSSTAAQPPGDVGITRAGTMP